MRVVAPIDGMVVLKSTWKSGTMGEVQEGEEVRSGLGILDVIDPSAMRVRAKVNQADVSALRVGAQARITLDSYPTADVHRPPRAALADWRGQPDVEPGPVVSRGLQHRRQRSAPDAGSRRGRSTSAQDLDEGAARESHAMKKAWAILAVVFVVALSVAAVAALRRDTGKASLPTAIVTKTTFIDFLQLRGEVGRCDRWS
jgi:hypothetical protein